MLQSNLSQSDFRIKETSHLSIAQLAEATNATFAGYPTPISHTPAGFAAFCRSNSVDAAQSVLLEHRDGRLAGLSALAVRGGRGWCGGLGIVPEFRGQGLSATLVSALIGRACSLSLTTLQLEVLTQNVRAIRAYERAGFQTRRELVIFSGDIRRPDLMADGDVDVRPAETPERAWLAGLALPASGAWAPCWQREVVSLLSMDLRGLIARRGQGVAGVLLYRPNIPTGPVALLHLAFADAPAARALLAHAIAEAPSAPVFLLNEPDGSPLHALLSALGLRELHRQFEMSVSL